MLVKRVKPINHEQKDSLSFTHKKRAKSLTLGLR